MDSCPSDILAFGDLPTLVMALSAPLEQKTMYSSSRSSCGFSRLGVGDKKSGKLQRFAKKLIDSPKVD